MADAKLPTGVFPNENSITLRFAVKGKRYTETLRIPPTKRNIHIVAVKKRSEFIESVELYGRVRPAESPTMGFYLDKWFKIASQTVAENTLKTYSKYLTTLQKHFKQIPIDDMTIGLVRDYCLGLDSNMKIKSIRSLISPLRLALSIAVEDGEIQHNVLSDWSFSKGETDNRYGYIVDPFTAQEQHALLAAMEPQIRNFYRLSIWSGIRTAEAIALTWDDVDLVHGTIDINKTRTESVNKVIHRTKTDKSRRKIKLLPPALEAIKDQRQYTQLKGAEVFMHPELDMPFRGDKVLRTTYFYPALKKAGVKRRNPYQCRHTFASMMLSTGESPQWVADYMGHANWSMITKVYGKWMPEVEQDVGGKAVEMFANYNHKVSV
jgi:integrase